MKIALFITFVGWALTAGLWKKDHSKLREEITLEKHKGESRFDFVVSYYRANYLPKEACR